MLQIDIDEHNETERVFILVGDLDVSWIGELMIRWNEYKAHCNGKICIVDVSKVSSIDPAGETALRCIACDGARFRVSGPMTGTIIDLVCKANMEMLQEGRRGFRSMVFCG